MISEVLVSAVTRTPAGLARVARETDPLFEKIFRVDDGHDRGIRAGEAAPNAASGFGGNMREQHEGGITLTEDPPGVLDCASCAVRTVPAQESEAALIRAGGAGG
jgi:hypothetical protein